MPGPQWPDDDSGTLRLASFFVVSFFDFSFSLRSSFVCPPREAVGGNVSLASAPFHIVRQILTTLYRGLTHSLLPVEGSRRLGGKKPSYSSLTQPRKEGKGCDECNHWVPQIAKAQDDRFCHHFDCEQNPFFSGEVAYIFLLLVRIPEGFKWQFVMVTKTPSAHRNGPKVPRATTAGGNGIHGLAWQKQITTRYRNGGYNGMK